MIPEAREVHLSRKDRKVLEACCRSPMTIQRDLKRARIVLLAAAGRSTRSIAQEGGGPPGDVRRLAASLCGAGAARAARQAAAWQAADLYEGHRQADSEAAGQTATGRVCPLDRPPAGRGAGRCRRPIC